MVSRIVSKSMDGAKEDTSENLCKHLRRIYNSVDDKEEMSIDATSLSDKDLVTTDKVGEATMNLKSNRNIQYLISTLTV